MTRIRFLVIACLAIAIAAPLAFVHWAHGRGQLRMIGGDGRQFDVQPLMPATPIRGHGSLDVRFHVAHFSNMPDVQRYQVFLILSTMADPTPIARHAYEPYEMGPFERREDVLAHAFEGLAPGDYCVEIEQIDFVPRRNMDGSHRADFGSIHKEGWWAEVD